MAIGLLVGTLASVTLLVVGLMGLFGRLPRNHFAGIRTRQTMVSDETWDAAHRAGGPAMIFAGVAAGAAGLAFLPFVIAGEVSDSLAAVVLVIQLCLLGTGVLASWLLATRAAGNAQA